MFGFGMPEMMGLVMLAVLIGVVLLVVKLVKKRKTAEAITKDMSKFCSKCGTEIDVTLEKCSNCGLEQSYFGITEQNDNAFMINRGIAILEIIGGIFGIITSLGYMNNTSGIWLLFCLVFLGIYVYSVFAGYWLWKNYAKGYRASVLLQLIQIPVLVSPLLTYQFVSGLMFRFLLGTGGTGFDFNFGSLWSLLFLSDSGFSIGVNIIPLIIFFFLKSNSIAMSKSASESENLSYS